MFLEHKELIDTQDIIGIKTFCYQFGWLQDAWLLVVSDASQISDRLDNSKHKSRKFKILQDLM